MGQIVCCMRNKPKGQAETMATSSEGNETASSAMTIPEVISSASCTIIKSLDQYDMQQQMLAVECEGVKVMVNGDRTFSLEGDWINVERAIEQLKALKNKKLASRDTTEENKEKTSDNCAPEKPKERSRALRRDLTPSITRVDHSLSQQVPIDQHVWYYLKRIRQKELDLITQQHLCVMKVVCDSSNGEITHSLEVVPYYHDDSNESKKHVDDAVEEFAQLYQKVSEPGIVKESIKLPLALNHSMPQKLITELEEMDVFFLKSDDPCLVGPQSCILGAKQKFSDFISGHKDNQQQNRPGDNLGQAQAAATDRVEPMKFTTPCGLTVYVSQGNLVRQSLDAIVNPANERLGNGGGAARAIADAAGKSFQRECDERIRNNGKLGIACVTHTSAGNLRPNIRYVIHTVGPKKSDAEDEMQLFHLVRLTVFNCLIYANDELKINSIAIPAISSGIFGVPIEIVGRASYEALKQFDEQYANCKKKSLREIHFLNNDETTFFNMKRIFQSSLDDNRESSVDPPEQLFNAKSPASNYSHNMSNGQSFESSNDETFENMDWTEAEDMPHENMSGVAGKKKENTSDMAAKNATKPDGDKKDDKKDDDDDNHCVICMDEITDKKELSCKHKFCRGCIDEYLSKCQPKCPSCGKVFGTLRGDQPKGTMTTRETGYRLAGYTDCGAIEIDYSFGNGVQEANHPNPGAPYRGTHRTAYLPANKEGRKVLRLLRSAFDAGLVFTIGRSNTTGQENVVIWNDVHHKTSTTGQYGYPDPTYLKRVTEELAAKGIK